MKKLLYILLFTISACSPDKDLSLLESENSTMSPESVNLDSHPQSNLDTVNPDINMMVNSSTVDCYGEREGTCLLVQEGDMIGSEDWEYFYFYNNIEGFNYEPGFVYGLKVKKTEVQTGVVGGSTIRYELEKIVYKKAQETTVPENTTEISTVNELIAGLKSGGNLYLKAGNYSLPNTLNLNDISNLKVRGADGAVITGDLVTLIQFSGTAKYISFNNIQFNSTSSYTSEDGGAGIVYFDGSAEDILFENCHFTCPKVVSNGLKFVSEGANRSKNITIAKCHFKDIGRMAIETQNHDNDGVIRLTDVSVTECDFDGLGLQSPYGMAISLSGSGKNAEISKNTIVDAKDRGIETVGWRHITIADNNFSSPNTACNPIAIQKDINGADYMDEILVSGNKGTVYGDSPHLIEISNCDGLTYTYNSFHTDALHIGDVQNSAFTYNVHYSDGGIGLYVDNNSSYNTFEDNNFVTTADNANTVVFYPGSTGNKLINNTLRKEGQGGSIYNDMDGGNPRQ